ncbi:MAG: hypothetical protein PHZ00_07445, partial [Candidatus Peribacteraceae bacterium]|nr:hypothetical protein [Candidatus Peribacteraceae bacterium]
MRFSRSITCRGLLLAIATAGCALPVTASCASSPSYQLTAGTIDQATRNGLTSQSYQMNINAVTWRQSPLGSDNYQIVPVGGGTSEHSGSSTSGAGSNQNSSSSVSASAPATNRRPRPTSASASSSSSEATHGAATSGSASSSSPPSPEEPVSSSSASSVDIGRRFGETELSILPVISGTGEAFDFIGSPSDSDRCAGIRIVERESSPLLPILFLIIVVIALSALGMFGRNKSRRKKFRGVRWTLITIIIIGLFGLLMTLAPGRAHAAGTVPQKMVYNGQLLNSAGQSITGSQSIRFSYWSSSDAVSSDTTGAGAINPDAPAYAGWQETHTVTPDAHGYFSVELGSLTPLPDLSALPAATLMSLFLQVEVKPVAAAETLFELLDIDPTSDQIDRSGMLSVPFALNADRVDQRHVGTGSGNIAILGSGGVLPTAIVPGGTNSGAFVLDVDGNASGDLTLQFGGLLQKTLSYSVEDGTFRFNDSVDIRGNLTVTGLINGMDLNNILGSADALRVSSGGGLNVNVFGGSYRLNGAVVNYPGGSVAVLPEANQAIFFGSGGLTVSQSGFPTNAGYIPLAEVLTAPGSVLTVTDRRVLQNDDRESTNVQTFSPAFEKAAYEGDGGDNVGQLSVAYDDASLNNFYRWTSTRGTLQDYDIILHVPLSATFARWLQGNGRHPLTLEYRSSSDDPEMNALSLEVFDTAGAPVTLSGSV